jgi:SAM-dependent methyltransferase
VSLRRALEKLRLRFRRPPRHARDVVRDYEEYLRLQRQDYLSHEEEVERWAEGLRRHVRRTFESLPRESRVLDCACGDGLGLETLRELGFNALTGIELAPEKAARARARGFQVLEADMHHLGALASASFDAVLCSHTLEHAYEPGRVLDEFARLLRPGGMLDVVLPYPDPGARNERAHVAKYELGTDRLDGGATVARFLAAHGFEVLALETDAWREPELWLTARPLQAGPGPETPATSAARAFR